MIYLDYNATAPLRPSVRLAMSEVEMLPLNPSSVHAAGRKAKKLLEDARSEIASALRAFPNEVIFTASGSEANNLALRGFPDRPLLVSAIEHASVRKTAGLLGAATIPVDGNGVLDLAALDAATESARQAGARLGDAGQ
ncbi:MAG: aminotransferase class V-fold PLP-dependent enzyme [Alphaproteobacteria bacterium]